MPQYYDRTITLIRSIITDCLMLRVTELNMSYFTGTEWVITTIPVCSYSKQQKITAKHQCRGGVIIVNNNIVINYFF